jgi:hypothetical protein
MSNPRDYLNKVISSLFPLIFILTLPNIVFAAENDPSTVLRGGGAWITIIIAIICYRRRANPIGGWLLFYIIQTILSAFPITIFFITYSQDVISNISPSEWQDMSYYFIFLGIVVLDYIDFALNYIVIAYSIRLVINRYRTGNSIVWLRRLLIISIIISVISIIIGVLYLEDSIRYIGIFGIIASLIWTIYFYKSIRVKAVFFTKDFTPLTVGVKTPVL